MRIDRMTERDHNEEGWLLLSAKERDAGMLERAIACFETALAENGSHRLALSNLLDALLAAGREAEAVARAEQDGSARAENWLGWYYQHQKQDVARTLEHFQRATALGGWWGVAHLNFAVALEETGHNERAQASYQSALLSGDSHDPALAHARIAAFAYQRGWLLNALSSLRRAVVREEGAPRGRLETWQADLARIEGELSTQRRPFPPFEAERTWIALERAQKREGLGVDVTRTLSKTEEAWRIHENAMAAEIPPNGPLAEVDALLRERAIDRALAALTLLRQADGNVIIDAIGLMQEHGEIAVRENRFAEAGLLLARALEGYELLLSSSQNQGEAASRVGDVERMRARVAEVDRRATKP